MQTANLDGIYRNYSAYPSVLVVQDHIKIVSDRKCGPNFKLQAGIASLLVVQGNKMVFGVMC